MSHQDDAHLRQNVAEIKEILEQAVPESVAAFVRHGNAKLSAGWLASVAVVCWGWMTTQTLTKRVRSASEVVGYVLGCEETVTRQGLTGALATCGKLLVELILQSLTGRIKNMTGHWSQGGKVNVAIDGSKLAAPRTRANQEYFSPASQKTRNGKKYKSSADKSKASTVQVLVTVLWHIQTGLPLWWKTSAAGGCERTSASEMLQRLPPNGRLIGDAAFVGYPLWSKIENSGRSFLVRVGSNTTFLRRLGNSLLADGLVFFWPNAAMHTNQPPMKLRLFHLYNGKESIYLVSNELDMSDELASELYRQRWGIEVYFRTVKETFEHAKLHCLQPDNVLTELDWTLLGTWFALHHGKEAMRHQKRSPHDVSPVEVIRAFQRIVEIIHIKATGIPLLKEVLAKAILNDESHRTTSKASRNYPRKKKHKRCGEPIICNPTSEQQKRALTLRI